MLATKQVRIPKLKFHKPSGRYLVALPSLTGKPEYVYLGKDQTAAERQYQALIVRTFGRVTLTAPQNSEPKANGSRLNFLGKTQEGMFPDLSEAFAAVSRKAKAAARPSEPKAPAPAKPSGMTVEEAYERYLSQIVAPAQRNGETKGAEERLGGIRKAFGERPIDSLTISELLDWRKRLAAQYAPVTTNHYLVAARGLLRFSAAMGWRQPLPLELVKNIRTPPPKDKSWTPDRLRMTLNRCQRADPYLYCWMSVGFLTLTRPSETHRMMFDILSGAGTWHEEGVYVLQEHKTATRSHMPRYIPVCPTAMALIERCKTLRPKKLRDAAKREFPIPYGDWNAYSRACVKQSGEPPHALRHSSATYLIRSGTARSTVDEMLGHQPPNGRVSIIYMHDGAMQGWRTEAENKLTKYLPKE